MFANLIDDVSDSAAMNVTALEGETTSWQQIETRTKVILKTSGVSLNY